MDHQVSYQTRRLREICERLGAVINSDDSTLTAPSNPPRFAIADDERRADAILGQLRIEAAESQPQARGIKRAFTSKTPKAVPPTYNELYSGLLRVVEDNGYPGVAEVLLNRFIRNTEGDINVARRASTGMISRVRSSALPHERGRLIQRAVEIRRNDFVQLLAPHADQQSLDESLWSALETRSKDILVTLLQYGANSSPHEDKFVQAAENGDAEIVDVFLRAPKKISRRCINQSLLLAASRGHRHVVLLLLKFDADASTEESTALWRALGRPDIVAALVASKNPPSPIAINQAIDHIVKQPPHIVRDSHLLVELLLCASPVGEAKHQGLITAIASLNIDLVRLLLFHEADINYNSAAGLRYAIESNRLELVTELLQRQTLKAQLASTLVSCIPERIDPADRVTVLSKLIISGAAGAQCSQLLITAVEQNDLNTARMLVSARDPRGVLICSVDYNAARSLELAVLKNSLEMVKILALEGVPSKFSLSKAVASVSPERAAENRSIIEVLLKAGAEGSEVDALLHASVTSSRKSRDLIELLTQNKGTVSDAVLLSAVSQGAVDIVSVLLQGNVAVETCLSALPSAMKLQVPAVRFEIVKALLGSAGSTSQENVAVTQAVIDTLTHYSQDLQLLHLLCQAGKANINLCDGQAVILATNLQNLRALDIVLCSQGGQPSVATVRCGINCAIALPLFDPTRPKKVERLLQGLKPQVVIDDSLVKEVRFLVAQKHKPDVLKILLAAGASINANEGASIRLAVPDPAIMDIILSQTPSAENLSLAFMEVVKLSDPSRSNMCQKLLQAGAVGEEINKALCVAASEGAAGLVFLKLLIPYGDVNYKGGQALYQVVKHTCLEALDILLSRRPTMPLGTTMTSAFWEAINITDKGTRLIFIKRLLMAQVPVETISKAIATVSSDPGLVQLLLQFGASVEHDGGQAILCAARLGQASVLEMLVQGKYSPKPSQPTLVDAFSAATALKDKNAGTYYSIIRILLEAGARGDPLAIALVDAAMDGDKNLDLIELLCNHEASVEWDGGSAINIAAQTAATQVLKAITLRQPSQDALTRAYQSAMALSKGQRFKVIEILLKAGKSIDENVSQTLTMAACESPPDRQLVRLLIDCHSYDNGESMIHAGVTLDLVTLRLLAESSEAAPHITYAFDNLIRKDIVWLSREGLSVLEVLLNHGATGDAVSEALCVAVTKSDVTKDTEFIRDSVDMFLGYGADVNYQKGVALQRATSQMRLEIIRKLLPSATSTTKAMALPHLFSPGCDMNAALEIIQAFNSSLPDIEKDFFSRFQHTDSQLEPILFSALDTFPRKSEPLRRLLDIGYSPNQWRPCEVTVGEEMWPVLCWALQQPEKRVSDANIETLIDSGAHINFRSKSGITPLLLATQGRRVEIVSKLIAKGAKVSVGDEDGVTPLALASRSGNLAIMEILLDEYPERNDGSLHDAANQLQCDTMRILIKHGHEVDYPSDRHDGRSALAELCLNAVSQNPSAIDLEDGVSCLVANDADTQLRCVSEDRLEKTILHFALDSADPLAMLSVLLKLMWRKINDDAFLYHDETFTYSLTKYVEKDIFRGPRDQKVEILRVLRNKRATDRFWASDIESEQPFDYCNPPAAIAEEIQRQKLRRKRVSEQREEVMAQLDLKRLATVKEVELLEIQTQAEIQQARERAENERNLLTLHEDTKLQLETHAENERQRMLGYHQARELNHVRNMGDVQLASRRKLTQEAVSEDQQRQQLQLGFMESKVSKENDGLRARLAIEGSARHEDESFDKRRHEREIARMKMQKNLIESNAALAGSLQGAGMNQRQIGYITGELK